MKISKKMLTICMIFIFVNLLCFSAGEPADYGSAEARQENLKLRGEQTEDSGEIFAIGEELFRMGKFEEAARVFRKSESTGNLMGAATSLRFSGNYKESVKYYTKLIERNEYLGEAYFGRGLAYRGSEEYAKALSDLRTSLNYQKNQYTYAGLGDIYILLGKDGEAKRILEEGNKLYPESSLIKKLLLRAYKN